MTRDEAIKYLIIPVATSTEIGGEKQKQFEAYNMAIEALSKEMTGHWIYGNGNGECSICGREKSMGWDNYCGYCGAEMED